MDRSFVEAIREGRDVEYKDIDGRLYSSKQLHICAPPTPSILQVHSLTAVVNYCKTELEEGGHYILHIKSEDRVSLISQLDGSYRQRETLIAAECPYSPFNFNQKYEHEQFIINMQAQFCPNKTSKEIIALISSLVEDAAIKTADDGVKQRVTIRKGVSMAEDKTIENPVVLIPYRTFAEVDQPEGPFVFRVFEGKRCALFEADGGVWRIAAVDNIRKYFNENLAEQIGSKAISVIG